MFRLRLATRTIVGRNCSTSSTPMVTERSARPKPPRSAKRMRTKNAVKHAVALKVAVDLAAKDVVKVVSHAERRGFAR